MVPGYKISSDRSDMDFDVIYSYISQSYWASGVPVETLRRALDNSWCFGVFTDTGEQVGFARLVTDYSTFAYLADVFVLDGHRRQGLSKWLMQEISQSKEVRGMRRLMLATRDAHSLYEQFGFTPLNNVNMFMENWTPDIYQKAHDVAEDL